MATSSRMHELLEREQPEAYRAVAACRQCAQTRSEYVELGVLHGASDAPQEAKDHPCVTTGCATQAPLGMTEQDDMENWNYAHKASKGVIARRYPYNYLIGHGHEMGTSNHPGVMEDG